MKRYTRMLAGLILLLPACLLAAADPAGLWEGTLKTPNGDMGFVFNVHHDGDKWAIEMDIPAQGLSGLPLKDIKVDGASVGMTMPGMGDPRYDGKLSEDGKTIAGTFNAGGMKIPMDLTWKSAPRAVEKAPANSGEVQVLEGTWEGVLDVNGQTLHVRFNFIKDSSGNVTGTFDSVDQGANGLPVSTITRTADKVKLDLRTMSISYEGTLNKDASTLTGTFTQGPGTLPLTLTRKKAEKN